MNTPPSSDDARAVQPPSARPPSRLWRLVAIALVVLLAACGYWLVTLGPQAAFADARFDYCGIAALVLGICLIARWMMRPLREGISVDSRNARLMRSPRTNWFMRGDG